MSQRMPVFCYPKTVNAWPAHTWHYKSNTDATRAFKRSRQRIKRNEKKHIENLRRFRQNFKNNSKLFSLFIFRKPTYSKGSFCLSPGSVPAGRWVLGVSKTLARGQVWTIHLSLSVRRFWAWTIRIYTALLGCGCNFYIENDSRVRQRECCYVFRLWNAQRPLLSKITVCYK